MSIESVIALGREALFVTLLMSAPLLGLALFVGVFISIFQAVTQIQEMTLTFVPKIIVVMIALIVFGPWILNLIMKFTNEIFIGLPDLINTLKL